jgi:hypothetical protein
LLRRAIELGVDDDGVAIDLGVALADSGHPAEALLVYQDQRFGIQAGTR